MISVPEVLNMEFKKEIEIDGRRIGDGHPCYFIAEMGANFDGSLERAKKLIDLAKESGADAVKFQSFRADKIASAEGFADSKFEWQKGWEKSVFQVFRDAECPLDWNKELADYCKKRGVTFFSSPYDKEAVNSLDDAGVTVHKLGSGDITWIEMVKYIASRGKPVIMGTGASSMEEISEAVEAIKSTGNDKLILLQCVTNYPSHLENANAKAMVTLKEKFGTPVGYSDHTPGFIVPMASVALGGCVIEKHFTDDKTRKGPDHPFAMDAKDFRTMVDNIRLLEKTLGKAEKTLYEEEKIPVILQRRCIRAARDISAGAKITTEMLEVLRPAPIDSVYPKHLPQLIGKTAKREIKKGEAFFWDMFGSKEMVDCPKSRQLWREAKKLIPGGTQLLSKRAEMFLPENWPAYFSKAKGVEIWDLDGNKYVDMNMMAIGACTLGYADSDVNLAVKKVVDDGSMATLNSPEEVELARLLLKIHPWAEMVRYARTGGESMAIAIRIARAATGRDKIAFSGYHGWHDWYLSCNLSGKDKLTGHLLPGLDPNGVPKNLQDTVLPFEFNNLDKLEEIAKENKNQLAAIVLEPIRHTEPKDNFLQKVREIADRTGAVLIFDEISAAWRQNIGGTHLIYGVNPDIAVFGKAMSNGYPMAAVIGKAKIMDAAQISFISSTYWTERVGPAAAIATINKMLKENVPAHLERIGKMIWEGWERLGKKHGLNISVIGPAPLVSMSFNYPNDLELKTLFVQEMLKRGYLASLSVYVSYAHQEEHVRDYLAKIDEVFGLIKAASDSNKVVEMLEGPVAHKGFKRLTW